MNIVTISGAAQNGKDTFAEMLKNCLENSFRKKVLIIHFADFLKFAAKQWYGWNGQKDEKGRSLLQYLGTDVVRKNNEGCWVNMVREFLLGLGNTVDYAIIPDARFPNEIDSFRDRSDINSVTTINVIRDNFDNGLTAAQKQHLSETALQDYVFDFTVHNTGTLLDYEGYAAWITGKLIEEKG